MVGWVAKNRRWMYGLPVEGTGGVWGAGIPPHWARVWGVGHAPSPENFSNIFFYFLLGLIHYGWYFQHSHTNVTGNSFALFVPPPPLGRWQVLHAPASAVPSGKRNERKQVGTGQKNRFTRFATILDHSALTVQLISNNIS